MGSIVTAGRDATGNQVVVVVESIGRGKKDTPTATGFTGDYSELRVLGDADKIGGHGNR